MKAYKRLKYFFSIHLVKTNTIIADLNFVIFLIQRKVEKSFFITHNRFRIYAYRWWYIFLAELDRIFKKIFKKLLILNIIAFHYRQGIYFDHCMFFFDLFIHHIQCLLHNYIQVAINKG